MTPNSHCYLDYYQSKEKDKEPLAIGGYLPVEQCYSFDPYNGLTKEQQQYILGVQGNLWTEYIATFDYAEYMLLPRISALAEVGWSYGNKDYDDFLVRLNHLRTYFDAYGWNYGKHVFQ
jgi:hexosaminidase